MMRECWNWKLEPIIQISEFRSSVITRDRRKKVFASHHSIPGYFCSSNKKIIFSKSTRAIDLILFLKTFPIS
ncbi:unnamed protein product [Tenebrio molitor]|nr:unnamed protein product [Tenebrio molitor]